MNNVVRLPTADPTFIAVRRVGKLYRVDLVTPCDAGPSIWTTLVQTPHPGLAVDYAKNTAASMKRPLRLPKALRDVAA